MEIIHAHRHVLCKGKVTHLRVLRYVHGELLQPVRVRRSLAHPDVQDIASVHYGEEGLLKLDPLRKRNLSARGDVRPVGIIYRQVARLVDAPKRLRHVAFDYGLCALLIFSMQ